MSDDYEVGYGKPPLATRFQPGQSGNPKGRNKKPPPSSNVPAILDKILNEPMELGGQTYTPVEIMLRALRNKAMKGDIKALKELFAISEKISLKAAAQAQKRGSGVLVVPQKLPPDMQLELLRRRQAQYREASPDHEPEWFPTLDEKGKRIDVP